MGEVELSAQKGMCLLGQRLEQVKWGVPKAALQEKEQEEEEVKATF